MEEKITIIVNKGIINNLQVLMERVDLKGSEVPAFVEIMNALSNAEKDKKEKNVV